MQAPGALLMSGVLVANRAAPVPRATARAGSPRVVLNQKRAQEQGFLGECPRRESNLDLPLRRTPAAHAQTGLNPGIQGELLVSTLGDSI
jgi:hypothetical protein